MTRAQRRFPVLAAISMLAASLLFLPGRALSDATGATVRAAPVESFRPVDLTVPHRVAQAATSRRPSRPRPALVVRITSDRPITARPGGGRTLGLMPSSSRYIHQSMSAWVLETTAGGRYGRVTLPFSGLSNATGWISLKGLPATHSPYSVLVDLSKHRITVLRRGRAMFSFAAATGAPASPTPPGRYFVTDRVSVYVGSPFGSFAFGISGLQTQLPPGWGGGNQLAIHGTNSPSSIGRSASAGCVRVSEAALARLKPLLQPGTPVVIEP